jgi:hypothetical protein
MSCREMTAEDTGALTFVGLNELQIRPHSLLQFARCAKSSNQPHTRVQASLLDSH